MTIFTRLSISSMPRASKSVMITANAKAVAPNNWAPTSRNQAGFVYRSRTKTRRSLPGTQTIEVGGAPHFSRKRARVTRKTLPEAEVEDRRVLEVPSPIPMGETFYERRQVCLKKYFMRR